MDFIIEKPILKRVGENVLMNYPLIYGNSRKELFFECSAQFERFLCGERCDSVIIGLLPWLLTHSKSDYDEEINVISKIPISKALYYQLTNFHIPTLVKGVNHYNSITINAELDETNYKGDGVGTGISGGGR